MSNLEDTSQITSSKPVKIKDPKRVEQGKKLAAISKAAKEKKAREKFEMEHVEKSNNFDINYGYIVGVVGILSTILYFKKSPVPVPVKIEEPAKLESFD